MPLLPLHPQTVSAELFANTLYSRHGQEIPSRTFGDAVPRPAGTLSLQEESLWIPADDRLPCSRTIHSLLVMSRSLITGPPTLRHRARRRCIGGVRGGGG